ncbi:MAG: redox-sensing transcriptional repressor Rex [Butyricicoccus sp.]
MDQQKNVSKAVIARLPRYYRYLRRLATENVSRISSKDLAARMGLTASQIRQDLSCFGGFGQQGYGYSVETLIIELERILGIAGSRRAILLGAGNLGRALLRNFNFSYCGVRPIAAFDVAPDIVGNAYRGIPVHSMGDLEVFMAREMADIAVLCVPGSAVEGLPERLVKAGIKGIWNFTNAELREEEIGVPVENVHFSDSLMALCYRIQDE